VLGKTFAASRSSCPRLGQSALPAVPAGTALALLTVAMRRRKRISWCTYVVILESVRDLQELAGYLSSLAVAGCDVVILDRSSRFPFERHARVLRWVGRHVSAGADDVVRAAASLAECEKVIVASDDVRYSTETIAQICTLLDAHEVVEPQDYLDPLPWWGGVDAARILVHRGIEGEPDHGATFAFRASAVLSLRTLSAIDPQEPPVRRLVSAGADRFVANDVFVRRDPGNLDDWIDERPRRADEDFVLPIKSAFFFSLVPLFVMLAVLGGARLAGGYAGVIAFAAIGLALRGRSGAGTFFPLRTCLYAPLCILERSLSVYWALFRKLRGADVDAAGVPMPAPVERRASARR